LSHTWNNQDGEDGMAVVDDLKRADYYRGIACYRRHLTLDPAQTRGKSLFVRFDAASIEADVYVNGQHAGNHKWMFAACCFDVTPLLKASGDNAIAVKINNAINPDI